MAINALVNGDTDHAAFKLEQFQVNQVNSLRLSVSLVNCKLTQLNVATYQQDRVGRVAESKECKRDTSMFRIGKREKIAE